MQAIDRYRDYWSREHLNDHPYVAWPEQDGCQPCKISNDSCQLDTKLHLNLNGKIIPEDEQVKLLGVSIDSNLHFNSDIKRIWYKEDQKTSALSRLRGYVSKKKAKLLLNTVVMSNFQYCPLIYVVL